MKFLVIALSLTAMWAVASSPAAPHTDTRLLRFADIHEDHVTFVYGGDIYIASSAGGQATRLTSHPGRELFPKFSPNGDRIAFSAEYNGTRQVFVMNRDGSNLRQLSYYNDVGPMPPRGGFDYRVLDWDPDGRRILVRANRLPWGPRMGRPLWIPLDGGLPETLAVPETGGGMLSPDGNTYLYTPIDREWRTWKRYRGGRAQDVWTYDLVNDTSQQLTTFPGTDHQPLWVGDRIFFVSDRSGILNLYEYREGLEPVPITRYEDYDILWPSAGPKAAVFERAGALHRFDPSTGEVAQLQISIPGERPHRQVRYVKANAFIDSFSLSRNGKRAVVAARGELFSVPQKHGVTQNLTNTPAARERDVHWSPDGSHILYLSDKSGEYEVMIRKWGSTEEKAITRSGAPWKFSPVWSENSKRIAWADKNQTLWVTDIDGSPKNIDTSRYNDITHYRFSQDGQHLAYVKNARNGLPQIWLYSFQNDSTERISDEKTADYAPVFDPLGRYLYFISLRDYTLTTADYEFDYIYTKAARIYAMPLSRDTLQLRPIENDDEVSARTNAGSDKKKSYRLNLSPKEMRARTEVLPFPSARYRGLSATRSHVIAIKANGNNGAGELVFTDISKAEPKTESIVKHVNDYTLASAGDKILVRHKQQLAILDIKAEQDFEKQQLPIADLQLQVNPEEEWAHIYKEAWRTLRDWFYDPDMHGQDWQAIYDKYAVFLPHVANRHDLDYLLSEIAGELNAGHIYVQSGDAPNVDRREGGLLGAEFKPHPSGFFEISKILPGENWHKDLRSPLTQVIPPINPGDFLLAVNGKSTKTVQNPYALLQNTADKVVEITVGPAPEISGRSRDVLVKPISRETSLRYLEWVREKSQYVEKLSNGRVGYLHLPNTHIAGNRELFRQFLPQINKEALIIDDRYNGGGFIPEHMIAMLAREPLNYWKRRGLEPYATPFYHHTGPKVMLVNGYSSSGGDALPFYFRKLGLGKIIGTRTWGGLIGISGNPNLVDGGLVLAATFRFLDTDGNWAVENEGITPDIEVIDKPELIAQGRDPSIERAVEELMKALPETATPAIKAPPAPTDF